MIGKLIHSKNACALYHKQIIKINYFFVWYANSPIIFSFFSTIEPICPINRCHTFRKWSFWYCCTAIFLGGFLHRLYVAWFWTSTICICRTKKARQNCTAPSFGKSVFCCDYFDKIWRIAFNQFSFELPLPRCGR